MKLEPVVWAEVLDEVAATLRPLAQQKGLVFELRLPAQPLSLRTDRRTLSQIAINLIGNAIKFTETGGVTVELLQIGDGAQACTEVRITDTGIGIKPEDADRLFQAFSQLDSGSMRRHEGTGLGLHLSQKLAQLIGGRITLHSEFGRGSCFTLRIPA
ncbi:hypothetical protein HLB44_29270 [Aquincola sp. S2]|uniref:histidine kinase n=1 Tax=Pseudaquabacterium terrae TaxID=2732868 RepID=A0ABX2EQV6_9BURK|nr:hypothetical protein [Aquabacterium terrae]